MERRNRITIKYYYTSHLETLEKGLYKNLKFSILNDILISDIGWILENYKETEFCKVQKFTKDTFLSNSNERINVIFEAQKMRKVTKRQYLKLQELFAKLGGLFNAFTIIIEILIYDYTRFKFKVHYSKFIFEGFQESKHSKSFCKSYNEVLNESKQLLDIKKANQYNPKILEEVDKKGKEEAENHKCHKKKHSNNYLQKDKDFPIIKNMKFISENNKQENSQNIDSEEKQNNESENFFKPVSKLKKNSPDKDDAKTLSNFFKNPNEIKKNEIIKEKTKENISLNQNSMLFKLMQKKLAKTNLVNKEFQELVSKGLLSEENLGEEYQKIENMNYFIYLWNKLLMKVSCCTNKDKLNKSFLLLSSKEMRKNFSLENFLKMNNKANTISNIILNGV